MRLPSPHIMYFYKCLGVAHSFHLCDKFLISDFGSVFSSSEPKPTAELLALEGGNARPSTGCQAAPLALVPRVPEFPGVHLQQQCCCCFCCFWLFPSHKCCLLFYRRWASNWLHVWQHSSQVGALISCYTPLRVCSGQMEAVWFFHGVYKYIYPLESCPRKYFLLSGESFGIHQ